MSRRGPGFTPPHESLARQGRGAGFTLVEVMVAGVVASVITLGAVSAFVSAGRMMRAQDSMALAEAATLAQNTLERLQNRVACDDWFNQPGCAVNPALLNVWTDDPLPGGAGTESIQNPPGAQRRYCLQPADCDGVAGPGDCLTSRVRLCWDGTVCPSAGDPCP
jgi:type II secretory pathway pseudopilin PulG